MPKRNASFKLQWKKLVGADTYGICQRWFLLKQALQFRPVLTLQGRISKAEVFLNFELERITLDLHIIRDSFFCSLLQQKYFIWSVTDHTS